MDNPALVKLEVSFPTGFIGCQVVQVAMSKLLVFLNYKVC